jgi:hypothetical protein
VAISISNIKAFSKMIAFLRARADAEFTIPPELMRDALEYIKTFARENGIRIIVSAPDQERAAMFIVGGALTGMAIGGSIAGIPGAGVGAVVGAAAGYVGSHLRVTIPPRGSDDDNTLVFSFS